MATKITDRVVAALGLGEAVRDTDLKGFLARKGKDGLVTFEARRQGRNPIFRVLGRSDVLSAAKAREAAKKLLAKHTLGQAEEVRKSYTLDSAWPLWRAHLERMNKSPRTIKAYDDALVRLDKKVRSTPLRILGLDPGIMLEEHSRIATRPPESRSKYRVKGHGAPAADSSARFVRALYRWVARRHDPTLPSGGPTIDLDLQVKAPVNFIRVMSADDLPRWWRAIAKLEDPLRQMCHLFSLLSGLRRGDLMTMRWENYGLDGTHTFRIPKPKGGERRRFDLILSDAMETCLDHAQRLGMEKQLVPNFDVERLAWVWPGAGNSKTGHMSGLESDAKRGVFCYLHGCRRTYATMARDCGVEEELLARLMNHRGGAGITGHYVRTSAIGKMLRDAQTKISDHIIESIGPSFAWPK
jgi:integrase